ncbi:MAG: hypothetical protein R3C41_06995 [Calditrichia bacterium]
MRNDDCKRTRKPNWALFNGDANFRRNPFWVKMPAICLLRSYFFHGFTHRYSQSPKPTRGMFAEINGRRFSNPDSAAISILNDIY